MRYKVDTLFGGMGQETGISNEILLWQKPLMFGVMLRVVLTQ